MRKALDEPLLLTTMKEEEEAYVCSIELARSAG